MGCCSSAPPKAVPAPADTTVAIPVADNVASGISVRQLQEFTDSIREDFLAYCNDHATLSSSSHACLRPECPWDHGAVDYLPQAKLSAEAREGLVPVAPDMQTLHARYLRPQRVSCGCSVARQLNPDCALLPEVFVSHCWSQPVDELIATLKTALGEEAVVWLAGFSLESDDDDIPAGDLAAVESELERRAFAQALKGAHSFLVAIDDRAKVFTRLWCVYEMHLARRLQKPLSLAAASMNAELHRRVEERMQELQVQECHAFSTNDCKRIRQALQGSDADAASDLRACVAKALSAQVHASSGFGSIPSTEVPEEGEGEATYVNGSTYKGQFRDRKREGFGVLTLCDGVRYESQWRDDSRDGEGKEFWPDGTQFDGQFCMGVRSGRGVLTWPEGSSYKGQFERGRANGEGYMLRTDGSTYAGQFFEDAMCGKGDMAWPDGSRYVGQFVANRRDGEGRMSWPEGTWRSYDGQWKAGMQHGSGVLADQDGKGRTGIFAQGRLIHWKQSSLAEKASKAIAPSEGEGVVEYASGARYEGQFRNYKRHGVGVMTHTNGDRFEGEWKDDKRHGRCKELFADGSVFEGHLEEGLRSGHGVMVWPEGSTYSGLFERGKANGQGRLVRTDGSIYEGQFRDDTMVGQGRLWWTDGVEYAGEFHNNRRHGQGRMQWPSGRWESYEGQWQSNTQHGRGTLVNREGEARVGTFANGKLASWDEPEGSGGAKRSSGGQRRAGLEVAARASGDDLAQVELLPAVAEGQEEEEEEEEGVTGRSESEAPPTPRPGVGDSRLAELCSILEEARAPPQAT